MSVRAHRRRSHRTVPLERLRIDRCSTSGRGHPSHGVSVLERLVAGLILIGALLWGASILGTPNAPDLAPEESRLPDGDAPFSAPAEAPPGPAIVPPARGAEGDDEEDDDREEDDEEEREPREKPRKGKGKRDG